MQVKIQLSLHTEDLETLVPFSGHHGDLNPNYAGIFWNTLPLQIHKPFLTDFHQVSAPLFPPNKKGSEVQNALMWIVFPNHPKHPPHSSPLPIFLISPHEIEAQRLEGEEEKMNAPWEGVSEKTSWRRCHLIGAQTGGSGFRRGERCFPVVGSP